MNMKYKTRITSLAALAVIPALLLVGCSTGDTGGDKAPSTAATMDELYAAAQDEGTITIYGPTEDIYADVYADFSKKYPGIEIVTSDIFGQELDARLEGELVAGGFDADLLHIGVSDIERYADKEYLTPVSPLGIDGLSDEFVGTDKLWTVPSQHLYTAVYNTNKVAAADVPTTWDDLLAYKGAMAISNPKQSGATPQALAAALADGVIDESWIDQLAAHGSLKVFPSVATALQATVTGETDVSVVAGFGSYMRQVAQGAPVGLAVLKDGAYFSDVAYAGLDAAPHPNAARLLVSWMHSDEGQASIADHVFEFGTTEGAPTPAGAEDVVDAQRIAYPGADDYRSTLEMLGTKF